MTQQDSLKKILEERRKRVKEQLEAIAKKNKRAGDGYTTIFPNFGRSEDENADEVANFTDLLSLKDNLEKELKEIETALQKMKKGVYGICEKCGRKISKARLKAAPTTRYCRKCKDASRLAYES